MLFVGVLSCNGTGTEPHAAPRRMAAGIRVNTVFPALASQPAFTALVVFTHVHIVLHRADSTVALDTTVTFPADSDQISLSLSVPLSPNAPAAGEPLTLDLTCLNAAEQPVFAGGPVPVLAVPSSSGAPSPQAVSVALAWAGPGAGATSVKISPKQLGVKAGDPFTFTATALDASGAAVANTPIAWTSLDTTRATITQPLAGQGTALSQRGTARIVAQIISGAADTAALTVQALPTTLTAVSGGGQSAVVDLAAAPTLPQPLVVRVTAADGLGVAGIPIDFTAASGSGTLSPASVVTDSSGLAQTSWQLGRTVGTQTVTATSAAVGGPGVTFTATGTATPSGLVATVVTPKNDTLTSFTETVQLTAAGRDPSGNAIAGSWSWVSRVPSVATVSSSGLVTAVADGSSWVVATEAGGTKDSAQITVQQRVASISVTPSSKTLYVNGTFVFTASAVDGRGVPMAMQPVFAWTSTQTSVATVTATSGSVNTFAVGSTQIRAASGAAVGVATLTVLTPITRIDVMHDTAGAAAPDSFTMNALGQQRLYRAVALDTLLNPMTGVTFTWSSTNPSVAAIDSTTATQARATAAANGVTSIRAAAQGVTGSASLTVAQLLASIDLSPVSSSIAPSGTTSLVARGKDANGRFITGGAFTFSSSNPSVATVNATTGVVTGVANGSTNITATSGAVTSNVATVTVSGSAVALISFGRDTLGVGRGNSIAIPVLLSKPATAPVVITLSARDTVAFWNPTSVTIPAGQTSANATLFGRNAGTTIVVATDVSGTGYAPDTAVVAVQANLRMTSSFYSLNATDQVATQALLSDPSPAGGTYVTFTYGTNGIAQVSPDPAFIPPGQLATDVVIRGLAQGSATVTPTATGVSGAAATVSVAAANLNFAYTTLRLGNGQSDASGYVYVPNNVAAPMTITLTSTDTTVASVPPSVTIPKTSNFAYLPIAATGLGSAKIIGSAAGWKPDTIDVVVTTPALSVCCGTSLTSTQPAFNVTVYSTDSARSVHTRTSSLAVRLSSSDTTVLKVLDTLATIDAGAYYTTQARVIPGGAGGTAYLKVTASGHTPDSTLYTVTGPALSLSYSEGLLGEGQEDDNVYVSVPNAVTAPLTVTLTNSDSSHAATSPTVVIPAGSNFSYFNLRGKTAGVSTIIASAPGYRPDTGVTTVTTPRVRLSGGVTVPAYATTSTYVMSADSLMSVHVRSSSLTVTLTSTDTSVLQVDSTVTIAAGSYFSSPQAAVVAINPGTAKIIATAPGHLPDTNTWTVQPAKLNLAVTTFRIGARQHTTTDLYVTTPSSRSVPVSVTLTHSGAAVGSLPASTIVIPANNSFQYFAFSALAPGVDTIIAAASGYLPDTMVVTVTSPKLFASGLPSSATTTSPAYVVNVIVADSLNTVHYASDTVVVHAVSSDSTVIQPTQAYFRIAKDSYFASTGVTFTGPGTASITYSDSAGSGYAATTTNAVTVTGPALGIAGGNPGMLGMRQQTGTGSYYVYVPNAVTTPLTVNLLSTDPRVANVAASVVIPAGQSFAYFNITAQDTIGTIQIQATATGYSAATSNMQVTVPHFVVQTATTLNTTSPHAAITVYAADAQGTVHPVAENVTVTLGSSDARIAAIDSATITIPAGQYYNNAATWAAGTVGSATLTANDARTAYYAYLPGTANVSVVTPQASFSFSSFSLGVGQYEDQYVQVPNQTTSLTVPITHAAAPSTTTPSSVTITNSSFAYLRITGTSAGTDTLTASPPSHLPAKGIVVVGAGRLDPISNWPTSLRAGDSVLVTMYARDASQNAHYVSAPTTFTLAPNAYVQFTSGGSQSAVITSVVIPADQQYVQFYLKGVAAGAGSATITSAGYTTYTNSLTVSP
jgi:uncharacterized protein YjdB